ncbi:hypothetical protein GRI89_17645 [Altererythrobacter salegens]|uniref:SMODS and SLOG-associating 2TM effector domain-containing protein n=1 Tax=Croceibacterium salegens TaxID=1737568 RepID=A0A6I4T1A3_9SPHN|nr:hypothetical protein [Croceibacterium salegens]MXO61369.1 hypothetical protein [Croceibacterium salegens]
MDGPEATHIEMPQLRLSLGVTGHRAGHETFGKVRERVDATIESVLCQIDAALDEISAEEPEARFAPVRLHSLLADGTDSDISLKALEHGYELVASLPYGRRLNRAINSSPASVAEARDLLEGGEGEQTRTREHSRKIRELSDRARIFGLADADELIAELFLTTLERPDDHVARRAFVGESSRRVGLAGRVMIEQSDLIVAVWDGASTALEGGTGHTILVALDLGVPVLWIDVSEPDGWRMLRMPEDLAARGAVLGEVERAAIMRGFVRDIFALPGIGHFGPLGNERWYAGSTRFAHAYRRVEALFGEASWSRRLRSLKQTYETPDEIPGGTGAGVMAAARDLPGADPAMAQRISTRILRRFAWADGIGDRLSDAYRGGMTISFLLSAFAIVGGISYMPFGPPVEKWHFALFEFLLLGSILLIIGYGQRRHLHTRWFETRRVAEYLRHASLLLLLGVARPAGRWPEDQRASWPEVFVRQSLREVGLPHMTMTREYLREYLAGPLLEHARSQAAYHNGKAARLSGVHHRLDHLANRLFQLAIGSVAIFLTLRTGQSFGLVDAHLVEKSSKVFTLLGVALPTFGAGLAGIRYFGDFQRFGEISEATAGKLEAIADRAEKLLAGPVERLDYGQVADLARATDEAVIAELESWQSVFRGKTVAVPV